jgi:hypothetical protein
VKLADLGKPVSHVWVCPNGHIDHLHYPNALDVCSTCGEVCEHTPVSVSGKKRRRHSTSRFEEREDAEHLGTHVRPETFPRRFELREDQLDRLLDGEVPTIAFPKDEMPPLRPGARYHVAPELDIFVTGMRETITNLVAIYEVHRSEQQVRQDEPEFLRAATHSPAWFNPVTQQEEPAQPEAEPVRKAEVTLMSRQIREGRIAKLRESLEECKSALRGLEERTNKNANICWGVRTTIERLEREISALENADRPLAKAA